MEYTLFIRRYGRWLTFPTIDELREELRGYFTAREIAGGIVERLTSFEGRKAGEDGYVQNQYQDFETYFYPEEN